MDARLVENAADPTSLVFKERGIFQITPKGLHVLERFISKNGIAADNLVKVFVSQPICMKLVYLERHVSDDDINITRTIVETVFKRFAGGRHPNYIIAADEVARLPAPRPFVEGASPPPGFDRSAGVELQDVADKGKGVNGIAIVKHVFSSQSAVDWLLDFTTCVCRDEAAELMGHFVRMNLIILHQDRSRSGDKLVVVEVKSDPAHTHALAHAEFRWGSRVTYRFTEEGVRMAHGPAHPLPPGLQQHSSSMTVKVSSEGSFDDDASSNKSVAMAHKLSNNGRAGNNGMGMGSAMSDAVDSHLLISRQLKDLFNASDLQEPGNWAKEQHSSTTRLRAILEEPALRALFREYLRNNYCDENLGFWLDVSEFRRRFSTTSSATGGGNVTSKSSKGAAAASSAMEVHQQHLVSAAMQIYHNYLAPMSQNELNIDHNLRGDVVSFIQKAQLDNAAEQPSSGKKMPLASPAIETTLDTQPDIPAIALRATQVQTLLRHYEKIQDHIFRLLATDQVPKFIRTVSLGLLLFHFLGSSDLL